MGVVHTELKAYFENAKRFDQDRMVAALRGQKIAWSVAAVAAATACCVGVAIAAMMPLKTVEPYVIKVDNATGITEIVSALSSDKTTYDEAVNRFFSGNYVMAREAYAAAEAEINFKKISLQSSSEEQARYAAAFSGKNPESPQVVFRGATAKVTVKAISMLTKSVASVRYLRTVTRGDEQRTTHWVATLTFAYTNASLSASDRLINPLGFVVSEYHADPETLQ